MSLFVYICIAAYKPIEHIYMAILTKITNLWQIEIIAFAIEISTLFVFHDLISFHLCVSWMHTTPQKTAQVVMSAGQMPSGQDIYKWAFAQSTQF